ncbi:hypothetical protein FEM03_16225 [Phragmitibacter flavus]|uniref:Cytochrome oxidase complex assembly protein 1 n=1 Tax=Phragmitibacter flavus TaxID=2576071 RepID=A0A5R8KC18_9BACT|nr:cytochrome c oxidase assembly factor Coa1 family protein [Phragmitibacter flavus]TLD69864.1 hypothetical protein FEM03_16225 [Phragmitibacter flavus]
MADIPPPLTAIGPSESEKNTKKILLGCGGCASLALLGIGIFVFGIIMIVSTAMKSTDAYKQAYQIAVSSPDIQRALGTPIKDGFLPTGSIKTNNGVGNADFNIKISGPNGEGTVQVSAHKPAGGQWTYQVLECSLPESGRIINLIPAQAPSE